MLYNELSFTCVDINSSCRALCDSYKLFRTRQASVTGKCMLTEWRYERKNGSYLP